MVLRHNFKIMSGVILLVCLLSGGVHAGGDSISRKTSYRKISKSLEEARSGVEMLGSLWKMAGTSSAGLPRREQNFQSKPWRILWNIEHSPPLAFRDIRRLYGRIIKSRHKKYANCLCYIVLCCEFVRLILPLSCRVYFDWVNTFLGSFSWVCETDAGSKYVNNDKSKYHINLYHFFKYRCDKEMHIDSYSLYINFGKLHNYMIFPLSQTHIPPLVSFLLINRATLV